jgi:hypothetical protein
MKATENSLQVPGLASLCHFVTRHPNTKDVLWIGRNANTIRNNKKPTKVFR